MDHQGIGMRPSRDSRKRESSTNQIPRIDLKLPLSEVWAIYNWPASISADLVEGD